MGVFFQLVFFEPKTLMLNKKHNWKNQQKQRQGKRDFKEKTRQKTQKDTGLMKKLGN